MTQLVAFIGIMVFVVLFLAGFVDMAKLNKKELSDLEYERMVDGNYSKYCNVHRCSKCNSEIIDGACACSSGLYV